MSDNSFDLMYHLSLEFFETINRALQAWTKHDFKDKSLWKNFHDDLKDSTMNQFQLFIINHRRRDLFIFLKKHNVWIQRRAINDYSQTLYDTLCEKEFTSWTKKEYNKAMNYDKQFDFVIISNIIQNNWDQKTSFAFKLTFIFITFKSASSNSNSADKSLLFNQSNLVNSDATFSKRKLMTYFYVSTSKHS